MDGRKFGKAKEIGEYSREIKNLEGKKEGLVELGNGLKADLEQLDMAYQAISEMEIPESTKKILLSDFKKEVQRLQNIYKDDVENPMEGADKELEMIKVNVGELIKETQDAGEKVKNASQIQSSKLAGQLDLGEEELNKSKEAFEKMMEETRQRQAAQRDMFSKQKAEVLRHNLGE